MNTQHTTLCESGALSDSSAFDSLIEVDRLGPLQYPRLIPEYLDEGSHHQGWVDEHLISSLAFRELQEFGPSRYDLADLCYWYSSARQPDSDRWAWADSKVIFDELRSNPDLLKSSLGLADGIAIARKDISIFRKFFGNKAVPLPKTIIRTKTHDRTEYFPYLCGHLNEVYIDVYEIGKPFNVHNPVPYFGTRSF